MVGVDSGSLYRRTHSLSRLAWSWVGGRLAPFYIHQINRVNSRNGSAIMTVFPVDWKWVSTTLLPSVSHKVYGMYPITYTTLYDLTLGLRVVYPSLTLRDVYLNWSLMALSERPSKGNQLLVTQTIIRIDLSLTLIMTFVLQRSVHDGWAY